MLTGTPLQNDLEELQNLLRFLMPKLFTVEEAAELQNVQVQPPACLRLPRRTRDACAALEG